MKVYIAGRITGYDNYKEHFKKAQNRLEDEGHIVLNPAELPKGLSQEEYQEEYMRICISMLYVCDCIYMLAGWEFSVGATIEHGLAKQANKLVEYEEEN